jgi:hypothetical protein
LLTRKNITQMGILTMNTSTLFRSATAAALTGLLSLPAMAGNGIPNGAMAGSFHLQVIAFDQCPSGEFTDSSRHMIAVQADYSYADGGLESTQHGNDKSTLLKDNTISLISSGVDGGFWVEDGNACENRGPNGAKLHLPITSGNCDGGSGDCTVVDPTFTQYRVYVRLVGKPNTGIGVTSCATEPVDSDVNGDETLDQILCSTENVVRVREGKKAPKFEDFTAELLTICLDTYDDLNFDGECDARYPLFDAALQDYFWQWNTQGRAHAQLVFVPVP